MGRGDVTPARGRAELLKRLLEKEGLGSRKDRDPVPLATLVSQAPLSFSQQRLWFLSRLEPESRAYYLSKPFLLSGRLDVPALQIAFSETIRRQAVLRTTYHTSSQDPFQKVQNAVPELSVVRLNQHPRSERLRVAREMAEAESHRLFDLSKDAPIRGSLYQLDAESHLLAISYHHIATDGWSTSILWRELSEHYKAAQSGSSPLLTALPLQYTNYALWQRERAQTDQFRNQLRQLLRRFEGAPPLSTFPGDRKRLSTQSYAGASMPVCFGSDLLSDVRELARREGITLYMVLLAAVNVLLFWYSGQSDVVIGSPIAGRTKTEFEPLIGFFVNNLALRNDLSGDPSFRELLQRVRAVCLEAFESQEVPFERLVEELAPERSLAYSPVFQVVLSLRNTPDAKLELAGLEVEALQTMTETAKFDWWLSLVEREGELQGLLEYSTDLFDSETIQDHVSNLTALLEAIVEDPDRRLSELAVMTPAEKKRVLEEWNRTAVEWPTSRLPFQQFEQRAADDGQRIAVSAPAGELSYEQVNRRANQLAHLLIERGVSRETPVGVNLRRCPDLLIGVLAIMKAGGTYVPLDPDYPEHRLRTIAETARVRLTLTQSDVESNLPGEFISLPDAWDQIEAFPDHNPAVSVRPDSAVYINFTSGSTGRPKGVVIPHSALKNLLESMRKEPGIEPDDTLFSVTSLSFDIATLELLLPLIAGASVYIAPSGTARNGEQLRLVLEESGANVMQSTPSGWRLLLESGWSNPALKALCGGEELSPDLASRLLASAGEVWNLYGPTETTIWSTVVRLRDGDPVTIGRPIANTTVYVLDPQGQPVPRGAAGQLTIGGSGLALKYKANPEETASRFVNNPFGQGRLYRTGDQVRWRSDGKLEFLGRDDRQVKLRGFRIELVEVESTLALHRGVRQAAVVLWRHPATHEELLVAHIVGATGEIPTDRELAGFTKKRLPEHMVPQRWNRLEELPVTANGKIDRGKLPDPDPPSGQPVHEVAATELEREMLHLWHRVLGHDQIGPHDNFFEVGGTSMLALRLIAEVEKKFQRRLPVSTVFTAGTAAAFASALESGFARQETPLIAVRPSGNRPPLFIAPGHDGDQFTLGTIVRHMNPQQPLYGLEPLGLDNGSVASLEQLARHYVGAMREVWPEGPFLIAGYCSGGVVAWEIATQLREAGDEVALLALLDAAPHPPARKRSPLVRMLHGGQLLRSEWAAFRGTEGGRRGEHVRGRLLRARRRVEITLIEGLGLNAGSTPRFLRTTFDELVSMREVIELHREAHRNYRPQPYPGKVALLAATRVPWFAVNDLAGLWKYLAPNGLEALPIPCARGRLLHEPFVQETVAELDRLILESLEGTP